MNQSELIRNVAAQATMSAKTVEAVLKSLADVAHVELGTEGGEVPLPGLGKLKATTRAARTGINPATGAEIEIPARNAAKFVAAKALKDALK